MSHSGLVPGHLVIKLMANSKFICWKTVLWDQKCSIMPIWKKLLTSICNFAWEYSLISGFFLYKMAKADLGPKSHKLFFFLQKLIFSTITNFQISTICLMNEGIMPLYIVNYGNYVKSNLLTITNFSAHNCLNSSKSNKKHPKFFFSNLILKVQNSFWKFINSFFRDLARVESCGFRPKKPVSIYVDIFMYNKQSYKWRGWKIIRLIVTL